MSAQCRRMWQTFRSLFVIFDVVQVLVGRKHSIDDIIISKFSSASISKRNMALDTDCINILIFMICILSVNQSNISFILSRTVVVCSRSEISIYIFQYIKYSTLPRITVHTNYQANEMNWKWKCSQPKTDLSELTNLDDRFDHNHDRRKCHFHMSVVSRMLYYIILILAILCHCLSR